MTFSHFAHPSILCVMLLYSVQGKHPVDLFPQQQQYLHASIHSTVVIILLVVVALYVEQRYIAYFVVWLEPRYSAYLSAPISSAALRGESVSHTFRPTPSFSYSYTRKQCSEVSLYDHWKNRHHRHADDADDHYSHHPCVSVRSNGGGHGFRAVAYPRPPRP